MPYTLPELPYSYDALEPHIDAATMEIHYTKHHQAYVDKLNDALQGTDWEKQPIEEVLRRLDEVPAEKRTTVRNHGGGHANHTLFWTILAPNNGAEPGGQLAEAINSAFGSFADFQKKFNDAATGQFGSGWAWLAVGDSGLEVLSTPNQDSPLSQDKTPILGLDVWEHAYYVKYLWNRAEYVNNWWKVISWAEVERRYQLAS